MSDKSGFRETILLALVTGLAIVSFLALAIWLLIRPLPVSGFSGYQVYLPAVSNGQPRVHRVEGEVNLWVYHAEEGDTNVVAVHQDGNGVMCEVPESGDVFFYLRNVGYWYFDSDPTEPYITWPHRVMNFGDWYPQELQGECRGGAE